MLVLAPHVKAVPRDYVHLHMWKTACGTSKVRKYIVRSQLENIPD